MNSNPFFERKGSLLVLARTALVTRAARPEPTEVPQPPRTRKRASYSEHHVLSPTLGQVCLPNRASEALLAWADTEPGVCEVKLIRQVIHYQDAGKERSTHVPLRLTLRTGAVCYWDCSLARSDGSSQSPAVAAKRNFAQAADADYRLFTWGFFAERRMELSSRMALQNVLFCGRTLDTSKEEAAALLLVAKAPYTVAELAASIGCQESTAMLVAAKLRMQGRVCLPLAAGGLSARWLVTWGGSDGR
jgi:hypothetical protein